MAAAYAAFTSLMHLVKDLHEHPRPPIQLDEEHVDSLSSKITFFQRFLEDHHSTIDLGLEIRIADAAHAAEDLIETHIADQRYLYSSLQRVIEGMDLIMKQLMTMNWTEQSQGHNQPIPLPSSRLPSATSDENIVVGIDDITTKIMEKLTLRHKSDRLIISITGMGGIGKTTLANKVYNHPYIKNYFDICAWATVSKDCNTHKSLVELLHCIDRTNSKESLSEKNEHELGEKLHKSLFGRRYLVTLDDIWDVETWERLRSFLPYSRGSGIVITTRESTVASFTSHTFVMDLLDERKSWDLFCKNLFGNKDSCPRELEYVGKKIANNCRGLPLSIAVIGGHLVKSPRTREYWEYIANNLSSVVNSEDDNHCLKILSLSYGHLPVHLKPCFLYMGIFPEDKEIRVSKLIRLWVAEGFLKPIHGKSLKEAAEDYLNDLIGRNLVLASRSSLRGKIIRCKIHDLLRDLSLREALEKSFLCIEQNHLVDIFKVPNKERRIVLHPSASKVYYPFYNYSTLQSPKLLRTLIFDGIFPPIVCKLLRVLSPASGSLKMCKNTFLKVTHRLVNLRCLHFSDRAFFEFFTIPPTIFFLWNLQSLTIENVDMVKAPREIWKMSQLRKIKVSRAFSLMNPPSDDDILKNLQSAGRITNFSFSEDLVKRVPNIKKLKVTYNHRDKGLDERACSLKNIARLEKLESFDCFSDFYQTGSMALNDMLSNVSFPHSLKKLTFDHLHWDDVTAKIGSLPLLEVLQLSHCMGSEWKLADEEGQFVRLKSLELRQCRYLKCFSGEANHFPCLRKLVLRHTDCLEEISSGVGDIQTLRLIELYYCPDSAVLCGKEIAEYQYQIGNEDLRVKVALAYGSGFSESLSTSNFHVRRDSFLTSFDDI